MSQQQSAVSSAYSRSETIEAIHSLYTVLTRTPYVDPDALVLPPRRGWPGVNANELRARGKTEEVITLLQHLPYLRAPLGQGQVTSGRKWSVGPHTMAIAYCDGEMYPGNMDKIQATPGHCIWITQHESRDGVDLLLDTVMGTITEYSMLGNSSMLPYEEYEALSPQDKWMAFPTLPVTAFCRRWQRKLERLIWMPVYHSRSSSNDQTSRWFCTMQSQQDEEDLLSSDEDFDDQNDSGDFEDGNSSDDNDDGNLQVSDDELENLENDADDEISQDVRAGFQEEPAANSAATIFPSAAVGSSPAHGINRHKPYLSNLDRKTKQVYEIYTRNGWPSPSFNREKCKTELAAFMEREEPPRPTASQAPQMSESDAMALLASFR